MKHFLLIIACMMCGTFTYSQDKNLPSSFAHLSSVNIGGDITIAYNEKNAVLINKKLRDLDKDHFLYSDDFDGDNTLVMETKINGEIETSYYVVFTEGPSGDPAFMFYNVATKELIKSLYGLKIYIPGSESVYIEGHTNNYFNMRKKYKFDGNDFIEVQQPFYYVGLKTETLTTITLYEDKSLSKKLAVLPANNDIEVLTAESDGKGGITGKFLVKTSFGLVGWASISTSYGKVDVKGIYFAGD